MSARLPQSVNALPAHVRAAAALETLTSHERSVLALVLLEKLSPLETARALGTTVAQIDRVLSGALDTVMREMNDLRRAA